MELSLRSAHRTKEVAGTGYVPRRVTNSATDMTRVDVLITIFRDGICVFAISKNSIGWSPVKSR